MKAASEAITRPLTMPGSEVRADMAGRREAGRGARRQACAPTTKQPMSGRPYDRYQTGDLATLFRLETRLIGRDRQLDVGRRSRARPMYAPPLPRSGKVRWPIRAAR